MNIQKDWLFFPERDFMKRTLILADNQDIDTTGDAGTGRYRMRLSLQHRHGADSRSELTRALLADPEAVAVIDYTV